MSQPEADNDKAAIRCPRCDAPIYSDESGCRYCAQGLTHSDAGRAALRDGLLVAAAGFGTILMALWAATHSG